MPLPDQTPKLPKWPFLLGDAALLCAAWLIAEKAAHPLGGSAIIALTICVVIAAVVGVIPFLTDYARVQDEALDERQRGLETLGRTVNTAAEQIGIAATGFQEIAELNRKNLSLAEQIHQGLTLKASEVQSKIVQTRSDEKQKFEKDLTALRTSESERLKATLEKISSAGPDLAQIEAVHQKHLTALKAALGDFEARVAAGRAAPAPPASRADVSEVGRTVPGVVAPKSEGTKADEPGSTPDSAEETPPPATPAPATAAAPEAAPPAEAEPAGEPSFAPEAPPRKRAPRKPKTEIVPEPTAPPAAAAADELFPEIVAEASADTASSDYSQAAPEEALPAVSVSADGATRLLVTAYIGIGNRLFIRGEGPGLNWDRGVPLQFVSIGKWRWESADATAPVKFKLYKNDEVESTGLTGTAIEPGQQQEVTASF